MKVGSTVVVCFAWLLMGLECTAKHMFQAKWHHHVIAQARVEDVTVVDGAYYFPKNSLRVNCLFQSINGECKNASKTLNIWSLFSRKTFKVISQDAR